MTDNSPLLTPTQRDLLKNLAAGDDVDRRELSRLRNRVRSIISDFPLLLSTLPPEERRKIFDDLDTHRSFLERKWDKPAVTIGSEGVEDEPDGPLSGRTLRPADDPDPVEEEAGEFHNGVVAALAFLYAGVSDGPTFEAMLEDAIRQSRHVDGKIAIDVDVRIDMNREEDRDELVELAKAGNLEGDVLKSLLKSDPMALFEIGLADENPTTDEE